MLFLLTIPFLKVAQEFHLLPRDIDGSTANSNELAVWRDSTDTTATLGPPLA